MAYQSRFFQEKYGAAEREGAAAPVRSRGGYRSRFFQSGMADEINVQPAPASTMTSEKRFRQHQEEQAAVKGAPAQTQRSGLRGERRDGAMSELSPRGGSEGYGARPDEAARELARQSAQTPWTQSVSAPGGRRMVEQWETGRALEGTQSALKEKQEMLSRAQGFAYTLRRVPEGQAQEQAGAALLSMTGGVPLPTLQKEVSSLEDRERQLVRQQQEQERKWRIFGAEQSAGKPDAKSLAEQAVQAGPNGVESRKPKYSDLKSVIWYIHSEKNGDDRIRAGLEEQFEPFPLRRMTEEQKQTLAYLVGTGDYDRANQYLEDISWGLNAQEAEQFSASMAQWAGEHPVLGAAANIVSWPLTIPGYFETAGHALGNLVTGENKPVDYNSAAYAGNRFANATGEGVQTAARDWGTETFGSEWAGDAAAFLAGTGLSIGQNVTQIALLGPASLPAMGLSAAGSASYDALESGANAGEAFALGTGAGAIELLTERYSLENLMKLSGGYGGKQIVMDVLKQMGVEASEEAASEILNNIWNTAVMGGSSEYRRYVAALIEQGMSPEEAEKEAFRQFYVRNVAESALGGALSGGVMGGGATVLGRTGWTGKQGRHLQDIDTANQTLREHGMFAPESRSAMEQALRSGEKVQNDYDRRAARDIRRDGLTPGQDVTAAEFARDGQTWQPQNWRGEDGTIYSFQDAAQGGEQAGEDAAQQELRYSLKAFEDGRRFVEVDTDQAQFDGLSERDLGRLATQVIKERFSGRVIGLDNRVFVNGRSASEYGFPVKHLTADQHEAKMRASTELDNLMDAGTNFRTTPDGRDGHIHPEATGDFQYFDTIFKVGGEYYQGTINIMQTAHGLLLKDVTQIENVTQAISSSYGQSPKSTILRDASMPTIAQPIGSVNDTNTEAASDGRASLSGAFDTVAASGSRPPAAVHTAQNARPDLTSGTGSGPAFADSVAQDGQSVKAELEQNAAMLARASSALGQNGQKALAAAYDSGQSAADFFGGFAVYYQAGLTGKDLNAVRSPYAGTLSEAQRFAAYSAGQNDAKVSLAKEKAAAPFAKTAGDEAGLVYDEFVAGAVESGRKRVDADGKTRTYLDRETAERIDRMAKDLGVRVRFAERADPKGEANGSIDGSEIVLERDNPNPVMAVAGHELAHRMQDLAPEEFRTFRDLAVQDSPKSAVEEKLRSYAAYGYTLTHEQAMDEVAADYAGRLMDDGALLGRFIEANRGKRSLLQRLRDVFHNLAARLRGKDQKKARSAENRLTAALETAYDAAVANAARLGGDAQSGAESGGERYSIKNTSQQTLKEQLRNYYNGAMRSSDSFYFGGTPSALTQAGLKDGPLAMTISDFKKSTREKHNIPRRVLNRLQTLLDSPILSFAEGDRAVFLLDDIDGDGNPLVVATQSGVMMDNVPVNVIQSIYGLDHPAEWFKNQGDAGKQYMVFDKEKADNFLRSTAKYYGSQGESVSSSQATVAQEGGDVKGKNGEAQSGAESGRTRYSLKQFEDGRRFVEVETDQDRFAGLTTAQMQVEAKKIIMERFRGKVIGDEYTAYVDRMSAEHYTHPANRRMDEQIKRDKMQASPELDNILAASTFRENVPDDGRHPSATGGLDKLDVIFRVNGRTYNAEITVLVTDRGRIFYDMTKFKDTTSREIDLASGEDAAKTADNVLNKDSVTQPNGDVNGKFSLKDGTITKSYDRLLRENQALRERAEYWRGQTRRTTEISTDKKAVAKAAKELAEGYGATMDTKELAGRLQSLYDAMTTGHDGKDEIGPAYAWEKAEAIARDLAESAVETAGLAGEFPELKQTLRDTRIAIGREYDGDIRNEDFRRRYFGRLKLTSQGTTNVDSVYQELSQDYPSLFPGDITHPADQLERILDVTDELYTVREQNPFSGDMEQAVMGITNDIVERFFELPQTRATFADRQAARLDAAKAHGKQRVQQTREQYQEQAQKLREENRQAVQRAVQRERETRARQIRALKDRYAQSRENASARRADRKARDRLLNIAKRLQNKKLPEVNRTLLNQYIGELDTTAKSMTGKTLAKLTELKEWYDNQRDTNPDFIADPRIEKALERLSKRQIADLSAQEVAELTEVLLNIENELRTQRRLIDSQERRDVYAAGEAAIRDIEASAGSRPTGLWGMVSDGIVTETLSPLRMVRRITGYAPDSPLTRVTQELADGQRAMLDYQMKAEQQFAKYTGDKGFTKGFAGPKAKGIEIAGLGKNGPVTATITPAMRASLYLHSLNDQNLKHIRDGGIRVPNWELYHKGEIADAYDRGTTIRLTPSQVRSITAQMTQKERAFAMAAHRYFNQTSRDAINAVSEKLKGYSIAQVENYFPIHTDTAFTQADFEAVKFDGTIEGMGFLKERVNAANPIFLRELNAELKQSYELHSKYVGLAIPVRNFNKLWNVNTGQWVDAGAEAGYNKAEGGGTDGLQRPVGENLRGEGEGLYADAGGAGADTSIPGGIARWAQDAFVQDPGGAVGGTVKNLQSYGVQAVAVSDAALKEHHPGALAVTENGVVYLSDALTDEDARVVGHHEAVHAVKQRGSADYEAFLENVGGEIDLHSQTADYVLKVITKARFNGQDLLDLTPAQQRTVFDELNAIVWGCYKADAQNAREQFQDVFTDYDGYIKTLKGIMEGESTRFQEENVWVAGPEGVTQSRFQHEDSVKNAIREKWGGAAVAYIGKMMSDLQNGRSETGFWGRALSRLQSNYAGAVLTLNASVAMKQAASYPTAAAVLGWGPLARAMKDVGRVDLDLIAKYTPLQWYRSKGFSTQELGDMAAQNRQLPKLLNWIQGMDLATTRKLWKASEYYVRSHNRALNPGTDAYYRAVADIYNQVIEETQPNYTTMQRPQLLRSDNALVSALNLFKTQPFQNFNIVYDAVGELTAAMRRGNREQIKTAQAKAGRAVTSQLAQLAVFAGMTMAWAMFRGKTKKYEDEEGELTPMSVFKGFGLDMAGGAFAAIPYGSNAWEYLSSVMFGDTYYGMDATTITAINGALTSLTGIGEEIGNVWDKLQKGEQVDWRREFTVLDDRLDDASKAAGVPYENVANLFFAVQRQVLVHTLGPYRGEYAAMLWTTDPEQHAADYYDLLYRAMNNSPEEYQAVYEEMENSGYFPEDKIKNAMEQRMMKGQGVEHVNELERRWLAPEQSDAYDETLAQAQRSPVWQQASAEQQDKAEDMIYALAAGTRAGESHREKIDAGADVGLTETDYILYRLALSMTDGPNENGRLGTYTNEEVEAAIDMLTGLSDEARSYLWTSSGKSGKSDPYR